MKRPPSTSLLFALAVASAVIAVIAWILHAPHFHIAYTAAWVFSITSCWGLILRSRRGWMTLPALLLLGIPAVLFYRYTQIPFHLSEALYLIAGSAIAGTAVAMGAGRRLSGPITLSFLVYVCAAFHLYWSKLGTPWWHTRTQTQWYYIAVAILIGRLISPFVLLTTFRRDRWWLLVLVVHFLDIEWLLIPQKHASRIPYGNLWIDVICVTLITAIAYLCYRHPLRFSPLRRPRKSALNPLQTNK